LSSYTPTNRQAGRADGYKQFRINPCNALFERLIRKRKAYTQEEKARHSIDKIKWYPVKEHTLEKLWKKPFNCLACIEAGRKSHIEH